MNATEPKAILQPTGCFLVSPALDRKAVILLPQKLLTAVDITALQCKGRPTMDY
jgi:hypothetical protein